MFYLNAVFAWLLPNRCSGRCRLSIRHIRGPAMCHGQKWLFRHLDKRRARLRSVANGLPDKTTSPYNNYLCRTDERAWIALLLTSLFKCSSVCSLPDIIRNKCSELRQRGADLVADNGVALARDVFEPLAVRYNDPAPTIFNDARLCELTSHQIHRRPPDPEHLRKKFLGQRKDVSVDPIPGLEQPAG
jgi:hypothetical protein